MSYDEDEGKFEDEFAMADDDVDMPDGIADDYDLEDENPEHDG